MKFTKVVQDTTNHYDAWNFVHSHWHTFKNPPSILKVANCILNVHPTNIHKRIKSIFVNCSKVSNFVIPNQVWLDSVGGTTKYEWKDVQILNVNH
jgi:hypothetical protein